LGAAVIAIARADVQGKLLVAMVLPVDAEHGIDPGDGARADARRV
jgi:hypothetical protein